MRVRFLVPDSIGITLDVEPSTTLDDVAGKVVYCGFLV